MMEDGHSDKQSEHCIPISQITTFRKPILVTFIERTQEKSLIPFFPLAQLISNPDSECLSITDKINR
jgi:hypothetical protein